MRFWSVLVLALLALSAVVSAARKPQKDVDSWLSENDDAPAPTPAPKPAADSGSTQQNKCAPDATYRFPFKPRRKLPFCAEYQELSCCDSKDAKGIQKTVNELISAECPVCHRFVADLKCSQCHPNAAAFWLDEFSSIRLCEDFCLAFYDVCADVAFDVGRFNADGTSAHFYLNAGGVSAAEFCAARIAPEPGCYRGEIPTARDTKCKCPTHDCVDVDAVRTAKAPNPMYNTVYLGEL